MIILMSQSALTKKAGDALVRETGESQYYFYPNISNNLEKQDNLYLVDLDANGNFQETISPKNLSEFLGKKTLLNTPCTIRLLVSDVLAGNSIQVYACALSYLLKENHQIDATIEIINNDINYAVSFISPPESAGKKWQVFGISTIPYGSRLQPKYETLQSNSKKELLWEGENINDWLNNQARMIKNVTKLEDDLGIGDAYTYR